jgi:hypothetical protein
VCLCVHPSVPPGGNSIVVKNNNCNEKGRHVARMEGERCAQGSGGET